MHFVVRVLVFKKRFEDYTRVFCYRNVKQQDSLRWRTNLPLPNHSVPNVGQIYIITLYWIKSIVQCLELTFLSFQNIMTRLFLLLSILFISESFATYEPIYKTINTALTGPRNVSYQFEKSQGLTTQDKQLLLDMYNYYRAFIGSGQENRGYLSSGQPPAAAMQALVSKHFDFNILFDARLFIFIPCKLFTQTKVGLQGLLIKGKYVRVLQLLQDGTQNFVVVQFIFSISKFVIVIDLWLPSYRPGTTFWPTSRKTGQTRVQWHIATWHTTIPASKTLIPARICLAIWCKLWFELDLFQQKMLTKT